MKEKSLIIRKQIIDKIKEIYYDIEDLSNNSEIDKIYNTIINMTKKTSFEDNLKIIKEVFNLNNLDDKYLIDFFFDKRYSLNINNKEVLIPMSYIKTNENINTINNTIEKINKLKATKVETIIFLFDTLNIYEIDKNSINKNTKLEKLIETNVLKALDFQELQNIIDKSNSIKNNSKNEIIEDFINDLDR